MRGCFWGYWRTLPDGRRVCIEIRGARPIFALAMVLVLSALAAGGVTVGAASIGAATATAAESTAAQSASARAIRGRSAARQGRHSEAWLRMGLRSVSRQIRTDPECVAHSFGQVRECLRLERCVGLQRELTTLSDEHGNTIRVSIAWVRMPTRTGARHFQRLVDMSGTGGISPIADGIEVRLTGRHYASRRSGTVVTIAEATTGSGRPAPAVLDAVADVAVEFPWAEG